MKHEMKPVKVGQIWDDCDSRMPNGKGPYISSWGGRRIINNFSRIWDSINLKSGNGWSANPWVWVLAFKVVKGRTV